MKKKDFDCVEMKRNGVEKAHTRLADMTPEKQLLDLDERTHVSYWH